MTAFLRVVWVGALDLLWPVTCPVCGAWMQTSPDTLRPGRRAMAHLHAECMDALERVDEPCPRPRLRAEGIPVWWAFVDTPGFFDVLHAAKYGHRPDLLVLLADAARPALGPPPPGGRILVPLPDDPVRRTERGYSVTTILADALAASLGGTVHRGLLRRRRAGPAQAKLDSPEARRANVAALFAVGRLSEVPAGAELVLVEDQVTSGATIAAAARLLGARGHPVLALALGGAREAPRQVAA